MRLYNKLHMNTTENFSGLHKKIEVIFTEFGLSGIVKKTVVFVVIV